MMQMTDMPMGNGPRLAAPRHPSGSWHRGVHQVSAILVASDPLEQDARTRTFYCAFSFKSSERPIESLPGETQLARYVLKLASQVHGAPIGSGVEIEIEH